MNRKVFMFPTPSHAAVNSGAGIPQVILNLAKHLPTFGWEVTENAAEADLIAHHAGDGKGACDVSHIHGLYPTGEPSVHIENWQREINSRVVESIRTAKAVTVPSQWVADILRRDMHIEPHVIGWAVDYNEWEHSYQHEGYVLWNKNRTEGVCTPEWVNKLAESATQTKFVTTFGNASLSNVTVTGSLSHQQMKYFVQRAAVYLATTKETGDIGSREALAAGVPVLGFRQGALPDFVVHGFNGFLAEPNDFDGLLEGLHWCLKHRDTLSKNALTTARGFSWAETARRIASVYDSVIEPQVADPVQVVIPCYNYGAYLREAVDSVLRQQTDFDYEVIIVDDGSTDPETIKALDEYEYHDQVWVLRQQNQGVAHARNNGINYCASEFIACLDADDIMEQGFLQVCYDALRADRGLGIAYTGLQINSNGRQNPFPGDFNWEAFKARHNQVPSLCMFRREAWRRAGGFRQYRATGEDADLWLRIASQGWRCKKVTDQPLFNYRMGHTSATTIVRSGQKQDAFTDPNVGYFLNGFAAAGGTYSVRNYDQPVISAIVPVGKGHEEHVKRALDSVEGQSFVKWEVLVINDTGSPLDLPGHPFAKVLATKGHTGASHARNLGIQAAQGQFVVFLDADDYLHPEFMAKTLALYRQSGRYIYTDWNMLTKEGTLKRHDCPEFSPNLIFNIGYFHPITALVPAQDAKRLLFDESLTAWEDIDFYMRLIAGGTCGQRLPEALLTYQYTTGTLREWGAARSPELKDEIVARYRDYIEGRRQVACSCKSTPKPNTDGVELIKVAYNSPMQGKHNVIGARTRTNYGRRAGGDVFYVRIEDANTEPYKYQPVPDIQPETAKTLIPAEPVL